MEITSSNLISIYEPISKNIEFNKILLEHLSSLGLLDGISLLILNTPWIRKPIGTTRSNKDKTNNLIIYQKREKKIGLKLKTEDALKTSLIYQIIKDIEYIYLV